MDKYLRINKSDTIRLKNNIHQLIAPSPNFIRFRYMFSPLATSCHVPCGGVATAADAIETDVKATEDLMTALRASRDQVPALNVDGVCLCLWF